MDRPALLGMLGPERVRDIGARYRAANVHENTSTGLRAEISGKQSWLEMPWSRRGSIDDQVRDDFAAGRTVLVDGWVLSLTEARQAALFSFTPA